MSPSFPSNSNVPPGLFPFNLSPHTFVSHLIRAHVYKSSAAKSDKPTIKLVRTSCGHRVDDWRDGWNVGVLYGAVASTSSSSLSWQTRCRSESSCEAPRVVQPQHVSISSGARRAEQVEPRFFFVERAEAPEVRALRGSVSVITRGHEGAPTGFFFFFQR